jgi:hypothetical protein
VCSLFSISPANGTAVDEENEGIRDDADCDDSPVSSGSTGADEDREDSPVSSGSTGADEDREDSPVSSGSNTSKNEDDQEKAKEDGNHSSNTTPLSNCALHCNDLKNMLLKP